MIDFEIYDLFQDGVAVIDSNKVPIYANSAFEEIAETPGTKLKQKPLFEHVSFDDHTLLCMPNGENGRDAAIPYKLVAIESSKKPRKVRIRISPLEDEQWLIIVRDISMEASLHDKYQKELKVKEAALAQLKQAQAGMIQTEKLATVGELVASISHELNNPLAIILSSSEELTRRVDAENSQENSKKIKKLVNFITEGTNRVVKLSRHLKNFIHSPLDQKNFVDTDVSKTLKNAVDFCQHFLKRSNLTADLSITSELGQAKVDPNLIEQVLINLIKNAHDAIMEMEKTPSEPRIELRAKREGNTVVIEIQDNGPGMTDEVQKEVFKPFFTTKGIGKGTGLGLGICRDIADRHNGSLELFSHPGQGSTFTFTFSASPKTILATGGDLTGKSVLVVEDEEGIRENIASLLRDRGCQVDAAANGQEGLAWFLEHPYDIVLTDLQMPKVEGDQMLRSIRRRHPDTLAILVSGSAVLRKRSPADLGIFNGIVSKPFTSEELISEILRVFGKEEKAA